ncbi:DNA polymerase III subunit delta', partial [Aestuariibius insulae]|uniref:DNA polymerase III subunit delta' n=1 Tax=Aestuariibius insulae TaxID=2058287 RepID=UPI00345EFDF6
PPPLHLAINTQIQRAQRARRSGQDDHRPRLSQFPPIPLPASGPSRYPWRDMTDDLLPDPTQIPSAPHPRETETLFGQSEAEAAFLGAMGSGRLHHGWLLTGPRGIGKATLAWKIAAALLAGQVTDAQALFTESPALEIPLDHPDRRLLLAGSHPRLFLLRRSYDGKTKRLKSAIGVDEVRALKGFFSMSAADGGHRAVIVDSADEMTNQAANALLKLLEEPPVSTTLLLISHQPSRLLPTIRSRCRTLRLAPLSPEDTAAALAQAGFASEESPALAALTAGSVGDAIRLLAMDGLPLYADLVKLLTGLPNLDRPALLKLAESATGAKNAPRFDLLLDLTEIAMARIARAGLTGPPAAQAAPGEALLLQKLSPDARAARQWAALAEDLSSRVRHAQAVNLDPAQVILDMAFRIEQTAHRLAA